MFTQASGSPPLLQTHNQQGVSRAMQHIYTIYSEFCKYRRMRFHCASGLVVLRMRTSGGSWVADPCTNVSMSRPIIHGRGWHRTDASLGNTTLVRKVNGKYFATWLSCVDGDSHIRFWERSHSGLTSDPALKGDLFHCKVIWTKQSAHPNSWELYEFDFRA